MIDEIPALLQLLKQLQNVPYLASKNIYRVAHYFLMLDDNKTEKFCKTLLDAKRSITRCLICGVWQEAEKKCLLCHSTKRDHTLICVVEHWQDLLVIEKTGGYQGLYHVLGGVISPLDGVDPSDLTIDALVQRCQSDNIVEVILALNQTPEGEATAAYIAHKLKQYTHLKISCLARGVPVGSSLEYLDRLTIYKALSERRLF